MIKLLYLVPSMSHPGGMERILTEKINYLMDTGMFDITIMTTDQMSRPYYFRIDSGVRIIDLDLNFNKHYQDSLWKKYKNTKVLLKKYRESLTNYINVNKVDVCVSLGGKELEFLYKLDVCCKKICEIHFAKSIRLQFLTARSNSFIWKVIGVLRTVQLEIQTKDLDRLIVLTKADERKWRITHKNVTQIYNFSPLDTPLLTDSDSKRVIAIGRLDAQKGFDLLIDAWAIVHKSNPDWRLDIFGDGEWYDLLTEKISNFGLENQVNLRGVSNDISTELLNSGIFVLSSRYEGFGMVLLEALSCGVPCVSFRCKEGPEEILTGDCGVLVEQQDVAGLAEEIIRLQNSPSLRKQMSYNAKLRSDFFSKSAIMEQWVQLFKSLNI